MKLSQLTGKKILILGFGKEGRATLRFLKAKLPTATVKIADKKISRDYLKKQKDFDIAIKTPGIKKELVTIPYTTATNIFFANLKNKVIGVTGSKGKSTTASLIYQILKESGKKVRLVGNIGNPVLLELLKPPDEKTIFVMELSSYQLNDIHYSPHIAVITNLFPEHMDYHHGVDKYFSAKKNIIRYQKADDYFIYNQQSETLTGWSKNAVGKAVPFDPMINIDQKNLPLVGKHNISNMRAAITVCHLLQVEDKTIIQALRTFKPLPHRLEFVGRFADIEFYDDAISTAPESTIAAIEALKNVGTIFLGGEDRGYDFRQLVEIILENKIHNVVLFPDSGEKINQLLTKDDKSLPKKFKTTSMEEAVKFAYQHTPKNTICLLSTASPSYSLWKNFEEKGDQFKFFVKKYSK